MRTNRNISPDNIPATAMRRTGIMGCIFMIIAAFTLSACHRQDNDAGKVIPMKYATFLKMKQTAAYVSVSIINPWDTTKALHRYVLIAKDQPLPEHLPEGTIVRTPLKRTIIYSSVHCSLLAEWNKLSSITGVCDLKYIMMQSIHTLNRQGKIADLGNSMCPDAEKMIALNPDAILLSPYKDNSGYGKLSNSGIPLIECADYMETSPLGRAEWMKFYGLLYGCEDEASNMFSKIEKEYTSLVRKAAGATTRPTVFADMKSSATWMVPGGNSTMGMLIRDAGAHYLFDGKKESGSVTIPSEEMLDRCQQSQFWLIKYNNGKRLSYRSLAAMDPIYSQFSAVRSHHVYACNTGIVPFYEEAPFHPERLLTDMIKIFHPELVKKYKSKYYSAL